IVPFSGGKDSTFTLLYLLKEYKIKPLIVQFDHGFMRDNLLKNNQKTFKKLGVDVIRFTPNWKIVKKLMLESLKRKGDFCWHCHTGIFAYPMHIAIKFNVPLVFWGEPSAEYTAYYDYEETEIESVDEKRFNRFINLGITADDMYGMINSEHDPIDKRDLIPYTYPPLKELKNIKYNSVCLGSFIPWDVKKNVELIQSELGWSGDEVEGIPFDLYPYEKIECFMQGVRDYIKFIKRGYGRVTQMTSLDIRHERLDREDALKLIKEYEGKKPNALKLFLEYLDLSEDEFNEIVKSTAIPPYSHDFSKCDYCNKPKDFESWYKES
ncbi:MAG: N-acetyl sugar amidotransferase, partial [Campylobacterales bacterium]|nr:N-acetyl sugar amidotransferase [Campylobacterales bacterium]